jgi:ABC-2 type transport system permease protein
VDRLIALVALRWRLELRAVTGARERMFGLLLAVPALVFLSGAAAMLAATAVHLLERSQPGLVVPVLSAAATLLGVLWSLAPILAGMSLTETHDLGRLLHYPVAVPVLVGSSLVANLLQPTVLAFFPPLLTLGLALAGPSPLVVPTLGALLLFLLLLVASGQAVGLVLHAISRHRRLHDRTLFVGVLLGVVLSLLPLLVLSGGGAHVGRVVQALLARDAFVLSPFAWGVRAAVAAGRGEGGTFLLWAAAAALAALAVVGFQTALAARMYRGELDLGDAGSRGGGRPPRMLLPGTVGALLDKDLKMAWRDPRLKAVVLTSLIGPMVLLILLSRGVVGSSRVPVLLLLASFVGLGTLGFNAFALERRGLSLLFAFPVDRFTLLVGKNLAGITLRLPGVLLLVAATLLLVGPSVVPAVLVLLLLTQVLAAAADNYLAILFPVPVPAPGQNPHAPTSGARGFGFLAVAAAASAATLAVSSPFAFLVWLPHLLGQPVLWLLSLPLALAGAIAVYAMLTAGATALLRRREPELLARVLGEE